MPKTIAIIKITTNRINNRGITPKIIYNHSFNKHLLVTLKHEYI